MFYRGMAARLACAAACLIAGSTLAPSPAQTLTMRSALSRALATSPRLTAAERDVGIATGQRIQAGALLNPELTYEQDNSFGSGNYRHAIGRDHAADQPSLRAVRQARRADRSWCRRHRGRRDPAQGRQAGSAGG